MLCSQANYPTFSYQLVKDSILNKSVALLTCPLKRRNNYSIIPDQISDTFVFTVA